MSKGKTYEMEFRLSAQANSAFSGTFSKAQAEFSRLGKEIQTLNRVQSDISAWQKQQGAVEATRQKLANLEQQQAKLSQQKSFLQQQIQETQAAGKSTAALERQKAELEQKELQLQQRIAGTNTALERQQQRLGETGTRLQQAGVNTNQLASESARLSSQLETLRGRQEQVTQSAQSFGETTTAAFDAAASAIAAAGLATALHGIYSGYMECVTIAGDFEEAMSNVEALSGSTAAEMAALTAQAKELGATTKFTAQQSAEAMGYMAMAGWDAAEMMAGMDGVMNLTAADGGDLATVSDIVTDSLTAFGLAAADTSHFADVLAATATNSNTSVSIMGETFKQSASIAGALSYSIEDVSIAVGLMANAGVKGSIAGTALKNMFNGLLEGATLTSEAFGEYEFTAVRADGTMKSFGSTINELRGYFDQMTESEKVNNAMTIAGQRGYNGLLAILNATNEDYASLTDSIYNCAGAAEAMAEIKLDNVNGDLTLMKSAWEGLTLSIGGKFTPAMRKVYSLGADVFSGIGKFIDKNPALVKAIGAGTAALTAATGVLALFVAGQKALTALKQAPLLASLAAAGPVLAGVAGVSGLVAGITAIVSASNEAVPPVQELTEAARGMNDAFRAAENTFAESMSKTLATANMAEKYIDVLDGLGTATRHTADEKEKYHTTLTMLCDTVPELAEYIDLETNSIEGGTQALREHIDAMKQDAQQRAYQDAYNEGLKTQSEVEKELVKNRIELSMAENTLERARKKYADTEKKIHELNANDDNSYAEYQKLNDELDRAEYEVSNAEAAVMSYSESVKDCEQASSEAADKVAALKDAMDAFTIQAVSGGEVSAEEAAKLVDLGNAASDVSDEMATLTEAYEAACAEAYESISTQYNLWDQVKESAAISVDTLNNAMGSQTKYWQEYNANLQNLIARGAEIDGLRQMVASLTDEGEQGIAAIAGLANATDSDLKQAVQNWKTLQNEQKATSESVGELKTQFTERVNEMLESFKSTVADMNLSNEARASAESTINSFIKAADDMRGPVREAYARLAREAINQLNTVKSTISSAYSTIGAGANSGDGSNGGGFLALTNRLFASGTPDAPPGWAWVGEQGPELINLHGGEAILPTDASLAFAAAAAMPEMQITAFAPQVIGAIGAYANPPVQAESAIYAPAASTPPAPIINIHIDGNATPETVDRLYDFRDEMMDMIQEVMAEERISARRNVYV